MKEGYQKFTLPYKVVPPLDKMKLWASLNKISHA